MTDPVDDTRATSGLVSPTSAEAQVAATVERLKTAAALPLESRVPALEAEHDRLQDLLATFDGA